MNWPENNIIEEAKQKITSLRQVADYFDTPLRTVENWVIKGMPRESIGPKKYIYDIGDIEEWVENNIELEDEYDKGPVFLWRYRYMYALCEAEALRRIILFIPKLIKDLAENFSEDKETVKSTPLLNYIEQRLKLHDDEMKRYRRTAFKQLEKDMKC